MAEAKFETAPWVLGDGEWEVEQPRATRTACTQWQHITDENGNVIALVVGASNDFSKLSALVEKHARLIAAAPDLYKALHMMVELYNHSNPGAFANGVSDSTGSIDEGDVIASRIAGAARAALAKATA